MAGLDPNTSSGLQFTLGQSFPGLNAAPGIYVGAPSAGLKGTSSAFTNSVSPEAGYWAGLAPTVNGQTPGKVLSAFSYQNPTSTSNPTPINTPSNNGGTPPSSNNNTNNKSVPMTDEVALRDYGMSLAQWRAQNNWQPQGISDEELNNAYNPVFSDIENMRNNALNNKQNYLDAATNPYNALQPGIEQAKTEGMNQNALQVQQDNQHTQNALAAARQLYNELTQGVQQRFGGVNSTGEFAKAFYGRGLQQQEGGIQNTSGQNQAQLATNASNIVSQYNNNVKELESKKAAALSQAQVDFQNRLDSIDQLKAQTDQEKANRKLDALAQLKATANSINQQFTQFGQQLALQQQSAADQLRNSVAAAQAYSRTPIDLSAIQQWLPPTMGGGQAYNPYYMIAGNAGRRDQNGNPIS